MNKLAAGLLFFFATTSAATATGTISCQSETGVSLELQIGFTAISAVIGAEITAENSTWSTFNSDAIPIIIGQGFVDENRIFVDFTDKNLETIIARARLFIANQNTRQAIGGTLEISDVGAFALTCLGP